VTDAFVLAVPADSELAESRRRVALRHAGSLPVLGFDVELAGYAADDDDERWPWVTHLPQADTRTLLALVRAGLGTALVPAFAIADELTIVGIPIADDVPRLEIALVTNAQRARLSLGWLDGLSEELDGSPGPRVRTAPDRASVGRGWAIRASVAAHLHAARARLLRPRAPSLVLAPACASLALVASVVLVRPQPAAIAPAPAASPPPHAAAAAVVAAEVASSGRWVSGRVDAGRRLLSP
jgi:hypothetical protein